MGAGNCVTLCDLGVFADQAAEPAGIGYGDIGGHAAALEWLTTGLELALRTGDPESALEQLRPLRASCLSALGRLSEGIQERAAQGEVFRVMVSAELNGRRRRFVAEGRPIPNGTPQGLLVLREIEG